MLGGFFLCVYGFCFVFFKHTALVCLFVFVFCFLMRMQPKLHRGSTGPCVTTEEASTNRQIF